MSGKAARRLRNQCKKQSAKNHFFSKKTLAFCAGLCFSCAPVVAGGEFLISVYPQFTKPIGEAHEMKYGIGGGLRATYRPVKFLNVFAQGDYLSMAMPGIAPVSILGAELGTGYHLDVTDRLAFDLNINAGYYNAKSTTKINGFSAGGGLTVSYKITPSIYADVNANAKHYAGRPSPLMMLNAGVAPGVTFNINELFNNRTNLGIELKTLSPVFPVLYSWYENNSFGSVDITNNEDSSITDVTVSFFQPQYMAHAKECATFKRIERGESVSVDLVAFFNEQMLELIERTDTSSYIIVNYSRLGKKLSQSYALDVPVYGRNNMSWDDDRRAAVFVSSKDPAAMQFAKYTASIVRDNLRLDVPVNIQYALGIFEALNQFGINYVVDPSSAFEDNVGTSSIDFLQFPYQTLMYRGGDCDDLSILVCSLFEAVGIDTAFITVPGHIYMAFNAGISADLARTTFRNTSEFIFIDDEVWVPLEITLSDEGFYKACRYGAREWNTANVTGDAALYRMSDSWKIYQPISVPGASAYFSMPESDDITLAFNTAIDQWSKGELKPVVSDQSVKFAMLKQNDEPEKEEAVIKETPVTPESLNDIIKIGNAVAALSPSAIREEEFDDDRKSSGDGDGDDDELLEDLIPLDFAIATATVQTDVPVKSTSSYIEVLEDSEDQSKTEASAEPESVFADEPLVELEIPLFEPETFFTAKEEVAEEPAAEENQLPAVNEVEAEDVLKVLEDEKSLAAEKPASKNTKSIVIISTITVAAALAAGLIILGKKKKREGDK